MAKKHSRVRGVFCVFLVIIALSAIFFVVFKDDIYRKYLYPKRFENYVTEYSSRFDIDENFIYAVIKTESGFDEKAESNVGARGLMQMMSDTYDWVRFRLDDKREITYDDMYTAEFSIEYGTFMLSLLYERYGVYELAAAAYHGGMNQIDRWISDGVVSVEDFKLDDVPSDATRHYISKVMKAYEAYTKLY